MAVVFGTQPLDAAVRNLCLALVLLHALPYVRTRGCTHWHRPRHWRWPIPLRYRRIVSNNCTDGLREKYTAKAQICPGKAPHGLHVVTTDGRLVAEQGHNATFIILMEEVGETLSRLWGQNSQAGHCPLPDGKRRSRFPTSHCNKVNGEKWRLLGEDGRGERGLGIFRDPVPFIPQYRSGAPLSLGRCKFEYILWGIPLGSASLEECSH